MQQNLQDIYYVLDTGDKIVNKADRLSFLMKLSVSTGKYRVV
jgi:hypothetical protein